MTEGREVFIRVKRVGEIVEVRIIRLRTEWWIITEKDSLLLGVLK